MEQEQLENRDEIRVNEPYDYEKFTGELHASSPNNRFIVRRLIGALLLVPVFLLILLNVSKRSTYDLYCGNHLERALKTNSVETARKELEIVVNYLEKNQITEGSTSVISWFLTLFGLPSFDRSADVGFWYREVKGYSDSLNAMKRKLLYEEQYLILDKMKQRMWIHTRRTKRSLPFFKSGWHAREPGGIWLFPYNGAFVLCLLLSIVSFLIGLYILFKHLVKPQREREKEIVKNILQRWRALPRR